MIAYALQDADGNIYNLTTDAGIDSIAQNTLTFKKETFSFTNRVVDRSFLDGALSVGDRQIDARQITFEYTRVVGDDSDAFRLAENTLIMWLNKTVYLLDNTDDLRVPVVINKHAPSYVSGSHKKMAEGSFTFTLLNPYWEDITAQLDAQTSLSGDNDFAITNSGYAIAYPTITITATTATTGVIILVRENNDGIELSDDILGTPGFEIGIIDCLEGTYTIEDLDRRDHIVDGTGFFGLPIGTVNVFIEVTGGAIDVDTEWRERYFI